MYKIIKNINIDSYDGIKVKVKGSGEFVQEGVSTMGKETSKEI